MYLASITPPQLLITVHRLSPAAHNMGSRLRILHINVYMFDIMLFLDVYSIIITTKCFYFTASCCYNVYNTRKPILLTSEVDRQLATMVTGCNLHGYLGCGPFYTCEMFWEDRFNCLSFMYKQITSISWKIVTTWVMVFKEILNLTMELNESSNKW